MQWKIWYDNGATFTSEDGGPQEAPRRGVQLVSVADPTFGRVICRDNDFYIWKEYDDRPSWQGVDHAGLYDYLFEPGWKCVLFGRTIGNQEFRSLVTKAINDPDLPQKSGWFKGERQSVDG
jgi:hypothetical protein